MADQACAEYKSSLEDLTFNSKPLINVLTMLAEDGIQFAAQIVQVIENHLRKVKVEHKLPVVYLIDSIIKNVGKEYLQLFRQNIVSNFCSVFEKGDEKVRMMLFKVRQTWSEIFSPQKLHAIDTRVHQLDPAWPVVEPETVRPSVHVNPKFLEQPSKKKEETKPTTSKVTGPSAAEIKKQVMLENQMKEKLKEKQQELLRLQQQKLVLELSQTKARLKEQTRQLQQVQSQQLYGNPPPAVAATASSVMNIANQSTIQGNAPSRDPRLNGISGANRDPRIYSKVGSISNDASNLIVAGNIIPKVKVNPKSAVSDVPTEKTKVQKNQNSSKSITREVSAPVSTNQSIAPVSSSKPTTTKSEPVASMKDNVKQHKHNVKESSPKKKSGSQSEKTLSRSQKISPSKIESNNSSKSKKLSKSSSKSDKVFSPKKSRSNSPAKKKPSSPSSSKKIESMKAEKNLDVDLRSSPKRQVKRTAKEESPDITEPPVKKPKESIIDELFGGEDKDYRPQMPNRDFHSTDTQPADSGPPDMRPVDTGPSDSRISDSRQQNNYSNSRHLDSRHSNEGIHDTPTNKREWTKYKVSHPDEYQSPKRPQVQANRQFGFGKEDTDLRYSSENEEKEEKPLTSRSRLESSVQMSVMVKNRDAILKEAEQQLKRGQINEQFHVELLEHLGKVMKFEDKRKRQLKNKTETETRSRIKRIQIDNKMREIKFENRRCIVVMDNHVDHLIRFKGQGRKVLINNKEIFLNFNGDEKFIKVNGREHAFRFGGPTRELIVDGKTYEGRFGADPIWVKIDGDVHRVQLQGPAPEVDVLPLEDDGRNVNDLSRNSMQNMNLDDQNNRLKNLDREPPCDAYPRQLNARSENWKSGSPPLTRNRSKRNQNNFMGNKSNMQHSEEWPIDLGESRIGDQRWQQNMHNFRNNQNEGLRYNSPPRGRGGPRNKFEEMPRKGLLPLPNADLEKGDRSNYSRAQNRRRKHGRNFDEPRNRGRSRPYATRGSPGRMNIAKRDEEFNHPEASALDGIKNRIKENVPRMNIQQPLIADNALPVDEPMNPIMPPPLPAFFGANMPVNPLPMATPNARPQVDPTILPNVVVPRLDVTSLFDKLVHTGIISKSVTGAGYKVGSEQVAIQKAAEREKAEMELKLKAEKTKSVVVKPPEIELNSASLKRSHNGVLWSLYTGTKCESCGVRFTPENMDKYSHHLDWHFRANRREKDSAKKAHSRKWYFDVEDWIQFEEIEDADERAQNYFDALAVAEEQGVKSSDSLKVPTVPASEDENENMCAVCKEQFELFWDENDESWRLRAAIEVDGKIYHPSCYEDIQKREQEFLKIETPKDTSVLPGLDLIQSEEEKPKVDISIVKEEPVETPDKSEDKMDVQNTVENKKVDADEKVDTDEKVGAVAADEKVGAVAADEKVGAVIADEKVGTDEKTEVKIEVKDEPTEQLSDSTHKNIDVTSTVSTSEEKPSSDLPTPVDETTSDLPNAPEDEKVDEAPRPEPERVRIGQSGSVISLNLCKSTVDSGLCDPNKSTAPAKDAPETSQSEEMESEEEMILPPPDPRFTVQKPVIRGSELSGLCSIM